MPPASAALVGSHSALSPYRHSRRGHYALSALSTSSFRLPTGSPLRHAESALGQRRLEAGVRNDVRLTVGALSSGPLSDYRSGLDPRQHLIVGAQPYREHGEPHTARQQVPPDYPEARKHGPSTSTKAPSRVSPQRNAAANSAGSAFNVMTSNHSPIYVTRT
jgi:hypothetical protein